MLVVGAEFVFKSNSTDEDGDYHRDMNGEVFENYIRRIAPLLKRGTDEPVVLVMDNAPSHNRYADKLPTQHTNGEDLREWLGKHNIPFPANATKKSLFNSFIKPLDKANYNRYAVDNIAREHGITILRLPPYHCDLNPIELVWGWIKRQLRDELRRDDKLDAVMTATKQAFKRLPHSVIRAFFSHVKKTEKRYTDLDGVVQSDPVRQLVDAEDFVGDGDSDDEVDVVVID
jgi:transposase